ncbi:hypothetical protein I0C86_27040 [Plantactinospora sp. S1510]|uniref:Uncharacterized protein n=1 Tax=Plantactinospora alkalitolerans TaxID=2789879 RepID=A0ABS0H2A2_9ACTN|nr:hypothetical protein [Plantactinospora alkalitolerans]MBF9132581.1 hypothetical protein [Plantactinospora alkalitolerans]
MAFDRAGIGVVVAAAGGAALAVGQIVVADTVGVLELDGVFVAGNERVAGVPVTLVGWFLAMAVPLAVALALAAVPDGPGLARGTRLSTVPGAAVGALAGLPVVSFLGAGATREAAMSAGINGIALGIAIGCAVAVLPAVGRGLAGYAALLWTAIVGFGLLVPRTVAYAGIVEPLGLEPLRELRGTLSRLGMPDLGPLDYHYASVLPVALAVVVLSGMLGVRVVRRTGSVWVAVAAAVVGPVLAAASYHLDRDQLTLWNTDAAIMAHLLAVAAGLLALLTATVAGRFARPSSLDGPGRAADGGAAGPGRAADGGAAGIQQTG